MEGSEGNSNQSHAGQTLSRARNARVGPFLLQRKRCILHLPIGSGIVPRPSFWVSGALPRSPQLLIKVCSLARLAYCVGTRPSGQVLRDDFFRLNPSCSALCARHKIKFVGRMLGQFRLLLFDQMALGTAGSPLHLLVRHLASWLESRVWGIFVCSRDSS